LNSFNLKNIAENLLDTFVIAGEAAKEISKKGVKVKVKEDKSPVTDGDLLVDKILKSKIKSLTPKIPIISEETVNFNDSNNKNEKTFWLIDPIDGTKDYINKGEEYTLNAALIIDLQPAIGIIFAPAKGRLFYSYGNNLSFEINNGKTTPLKGEKKNLNHIIGLENSGKTPDEILEIYKKNKVSKTIRMSSSLKFCALASGEADVYAAIPRAFEWDIAAGHAILEHSGGIVTDLQEKKFLYGKKNYKNLSLIAKRTSKLYT
jgi:3'(2'), 5'-bisphosphate nucleotidase